jgi:hypothetical protein
MISLEDFVFIFYQINLQLVLNCGDKFLPSGSRVSHANILGKSNLVNIVKSPIRSMKKDKK